MRHLKVHFYRQVPSIVVRMGVCVCVCARVCACVCMCASSLTIAACAAPCRSHSLSWRRFVIEAMPKKLVQTTMKCKKKKKTIKLREEANLPCVWVSRVHLHSITLRSAGDAAWTRVVCQTVLPHYTRTQADVCVCVRACACMTYAAIWSLPALKKKKNKTTFLNLVKELCLLLLFSKLFSAVFCCVFCVVFFLVFLRARFARESNFLNIS